jgi:S1/P1 Nuclease
MRRNLTLLSLSMFFIGSCAPAFAWYDFGHEAVATIAWNKLNPQTKERVKTLLAKNPYYSRWVAAVPAGTSDAEKDLLIFAQSATWPDAIKHDSAYTADGAEKGNKPDGPQCAENIGYSDKRLHKYWHYDDEPFSPDHTPLPPHATPNAQTQIEAFRKVLASDSTDDLKSYDLVWLIHLVGDVHQPLHCVTRVIHDDPNGDKGGNDCKLTGKPDNLHSEWDGIVGDDRTLQPAVDFGKNLPDAPKGQAKKKDEKVWIAESFKLARKKVYAKPIGKTNGPFELTDEYKQQARKIGEERVELAGARLANLLNTELK